jgi:hypothetical protein
VAIVLGVAELPPEVTDVFRGRRIVGQLVEDREEVMERPDRGDERGDSEEAPGSGEGESGLDQRQGDRVPIEVLGERPIRWPNDPDDARSPAVAVEQASDVLHRGEGGVEDPGRATSKDSR